VTPDSVVKAPWLPQLKLGGGYISGHVDSKMFGNGRAPSWVNNGHTLELGPSHLAESSDETSKHQNRRLREISGYHAEIPVDKEAAKSVANNQAKALGAKLDSKMAPLKEGHFQALQQLVNPNAGFIDIGGLSSLNFQGPSLKDNATDEGWDETSSIYDLLQIHLHWGKNDGEGSEQTVGGKAHPLEMHVVHTQRGNPYPARSPGGLVVVSVMFEVGEPNPDLSEIISEIQKGGSISKFGGEVPLSATCHVRNLLPKDFERNYLTYRGSLTTPGCFQSVNWIIAGKTLPVSHKQLQSLRSVEGLEPGASLTHNYRPVQPKYGRVVWMKGNSSFDHLKSSSGR